MAGEISLDPARLENVKHLDNGAIRAACPACRAANSDKSGDHLLIQADGKFGCATHPDDREHRKEIFKLAGTRPSAVPSPNGNGRHFVCAYDYHDASGKLVFQVCRYSNKDFRQRHPDPTKPGKWLWNMDGVRRVLYRLPEVLKAKKHGHAITIAEGEKDVNELAQRGIVATCNVGGAGKWRKDYSESLRGCPPMADIPAVAGK
jgi:hypothetical protein